MCVIVRLNSTKYSNQMTNFNIISNYIIVNNFELNYGIVVIIPSGKLDFIYIEIVSFAFIHLLERNSEFI